MKIFSLALTTCFCLLFFSCSTNKDQNQYSLVENKDKLIIPIDTTISNYSTLLRYTEQGSKELIVYYNKPKHSLAMFDINDKKLLNTINFQKDGPNGVYRLIGCYVKNLDSIFVIPAYYKKVYLTDSKGSIKNIYDLTQFESIGENNLEKMDIKGDRYSPLVMSGNNLLIGTTPSENPLSPNFTKIPLGISLDIKNNKINTSFTHFPEIYTQQSFGAFHSYYYTTLTDNGKMVWSYPADKNIYVTDNKGVKVESFVTESEVSDGEISPCIAEGQEQFERYYLSNWAYDRIFYDKFRKVYYRFVLGKYTEKRTVPTLFMGSYKPFSIIILDESFKKVGETKLPENVHYIENAFVGKKGLYISNSHPDNPDNQEDQISFTCYELLKNK